MLCFVFDRRALLGLHRAAVSHGMSAAIKYDVQKINEKKTKQWKFERRGKFIVRKSFPRGIVIWIVDKKKFFLSECTRYIFNDYL